jgi:hypothetical protein
MDPRVKPEDDNLKCLFLFVIPAGIKRESISLMNISTFANEANKTIEKIRESNPDYL